MRWILVAVLAGLGLLMTTTVATAHGSGGGGGGRGGGRTYTYVPIYVGTYAPLPPFTGEEAAMAVEITDSAPTMIEGDIKRGDVVARHELRAVDAIILLEPVVKANGETIPVGVPLARMAFAAPGSHPTIWCDVRPNHRLFYPNAHDCFEDTKGDGRLDEIWASNSQDNFVGFAISGVGDRIDLLPHPAAYRAAKPEERPKAVLGFSFCDGDNISGPARFSLALAIAEPADFKPTMGRCRFGVWPDPADKSKLQVDHLSITLTPTADSAVLHFKVANRLTAGVLGKVTADGPVQRLADVVAPPEPTGSKPPPSPVLVPTGDPQVTLGPVAIGQTFFVLPVRHAITGVLQNRVHPSTGIVWPEGTMLEVGQPVFGVPDAGEGDDKIAWCAPKAMKGVYRTDCLLPMRGGYLYAGNRTPVMAPTIKSLLTDWPTGALNSDPSVKVGPADLPPLKQTLTLSSVSPLSEIDHSLVYHIDVGLDWGEGPKVVHQVAYVLPPAGEVVHLLGAALLLRPGDAGGGMLVERPAQGGGK